MTKPTPKPAKPSKAKSKAGAAHKSPPPRKPPAGLTPRQQRFVDEYLVDLNATQAAIRAGYSPGTAGAIGFALLQKPEIEAGIAAARLKQQERTQITADRVVSELAMIALADARELVEYIVGCCRHCHGEGFNWQRTVAEMNHDREQWAEKGKPPDEFDVRGGIGFNPHKAPHPACPECMGRGHGRTFVCDTRKLSPAAAALYAGVKETKDGIEVKMHSKMEAFEKLAKHLGLYERHNQQKADPLKVLLTAIAGQSGGSAMSSFQPVARDPEHDED